MSNDMDLDLSLSLGPPRIPSVPPEPPRIPFVPPEPPVPCLSNGKPVMIPAPYPWATNKRATVHSLDYLRNNGITTITGQMHCGHCKHIFEESFNLEDRFRKLSDFVMKNRDNMHDRAPERWQKPALPGCPNCNSHHAKPYITKKRAINWLFLFLGEYISCCKIDVLKYFCKYASHHRTASKNHLVYIAYMGLFQQLVE